MDDHILCKTMVCNMKNCVQCERRGFFNLKTANTTSIVAGFAHQRLGVGPRETEVVTLRVAVTVYQKLCHVEKQAFINALAGL